MGWTRRDCRQSDQYRKNFGSSGGGSLKRSKKANRPEPANRNPPVGRLKSLFLRRKVATLFLRLRWKKWPCWAVGSARSLRKAVRSPELWVLSQNGIR